MTRTIINVCLWSRKFQIVHNTSNGPIVFGPAFNDTFLKTVLYLQEEIKEVHFIVLYFYGICVCVKNKDQNFEE